MVEATTSESRDFRVENFGNKDGVESELFWIPNAKSETNQNSTSLTFDDAKTSLNPPI
jgi:hypothetical protein